MGWKDLLVHVDGGKAVDSRINAAIGLAQTFGAHLTSLVVLEEPVVPGFVMAGVPSGVREGQIAGLKRRAEALAERSGDMIGRAGLTVDSRMDRAAGGDVARVLSVHARHADLTILGQADPDDGRPGDSGLVGDVALAAGRPVLVIPYIGAGASLGENVMVAWDGGREATRAVNDALPILKRARKVIVVAVNAAEAPDRYGGVGGADISLHLARHGVEVTVQGLEVRDIGVADALLSRLADEAADLLVMGAYGHSRLRETLLGGVTRDILRTMTVPVLMSH